MYNQNQQIYWNTETAPCLKIWNHYQLGSNISSRNWVKLVNSVNSLWTFDKPNELKHLLEIADHGQVLKHCAIGKDLSGVQS